MILLSGSGSVGRASPCQGGGRGSESRLPLQIFNVWGYKIMGSGSKPVN